MVQHIVESNALEGTPVTPEALPIRAVSGKRAASILESALYSIDINEVTRLPFPTMRSLSGSATPALVDDKIPAEAKLY